MSTHPKPTKLQTKAQIEVTARLTGVWQNIWSLIEHTENLEDTTRGALCTLMAAVTFIIQEEGGEQPEP